MSPVVHTGLAAVPFAGTERLVQRGGGPLRVRQTNP
jgi:hypothetical protein